MYPKVGHLSALQLSPQVTFVQTVRQTLSRAHWRFCPRANLHARNGHTHQHGRFCIGYTGYIPRNLYSLHAPDTKIHPNIPIPQNLIPFSPKIPPFPACLGGALVLSSQFSWELEALRGVGAEEAERNNTCGWRWFPVLVAVLEGNQRDPKLLFRFFPPFFWGGGWLALQKDAP